MHIRLPYNAILGYPALAKFMSVIHHGYNILKMPGSGGIITVPCEERDAVRSLKRAFQTVAIDDPDSRNEGPLEAIPKKKKPRRAGPQEDGVAAGASSGSAPAPGAPPSTAEESAPGALLRQGSGALFWRASDLANLTREALGHHLEACLTTHLPQEST